MNPSRNVKNHSMLEEPPTLTLVQTLPVKATLLPCHECKILTGKKGMTERDNINIMKESGP